MHMQLFSSIAILGLAGAASDSPGDEPSRGPDLKPVTVVVVDRDGEVPIGSFSYRAWFEEAVRVKPEESKAWTPVVSGDGRFEMPAPTACLLFVLVKAPDYIGGSEMWGEYAIKSTDNPRKVVVRLRRGITVKGVVHDARTREPIAGATVTPLAPALPIWDRDEDKQVKTGADGKYQVRGVDPVLGVTASHPDYRDSSDFPDVKPIGPEHDFFLPPGLTIHVRVVDSDGMPLEGVRLDDFLSNLKQKPKVATGLDGTLILKNPDYGFGLTFRKDGFVEKEIESEEVERSRTDPKGLVVVMERTIPLMGRVVAPDGRPVAVFAIAAGPSEPISRYRSKEAPVVTDAASKIPSSSHAVRAEVQEVEGKFRLGLVKEGRTWVGVASQGFAAWEGWVDFKRGGAPLEVRLLPGFVVSARVDVPDHLRGRIKARLVPRRDRSDIGGLPSNPPAEELATRPAAVSPDGVLRFEHVRPDRYRLIVEAPGTRETELAIDVPRADLDLGPIRIDFPRATGQIEGRVWRPKSEKGGAWSFAKGYLRPFPSRGSSDEVVEIPFRADEEGRFRVDRVPVGLTTVQFPYQVFDVVDSHAWTALVVDGQTTTVGAFDPEAHREFTLTLGIGDGSKSQYESGTGLGASRKVDNVNIVKPFPLPSPDEKAKEPKPREPLFSVELKPLSKGPLAYAQPGWEELAPQRKVVLPDVSPGSYRLRIGDWLGWGDLEGGPLFDGEVVVPAGGLGEVVIPLGAGCITGKIPTPKENYERPVEVTAVAKGSGLPPRRARCDDEGNFCVRYLSPGIYSLFIHDPNSGFGRVDDVKVQADVVDVGERRLSSGGRVGGEIHFPRLTSLPDEVVAVDASGVTVRRAFQVYSSFDRVDLAGLWPGSWTISARKRDTVLASGELRIEGTGPFHLNVTAGGSPKP